MARTRRTRTTYPSNRSFLTGCSDSIAAGPSAMLHRSTGLSHRQIRARRRFTAVLRQSRLRTTVRNYPQRLAICFDLDQKY